MNKKSQKGKHSQANLGQQGPHGQPPMEAQGEWGHRPPVPPNQSPVKVPGGLGHGPPFAPNQPPAYRPYSQPGGQAGPHDIYAYTQQPPPTASQPYGGFPGYGKPQSGPMLPPPALYSQHIPPQTTHQFPRFPSQPGPPPVGPTGFFPPQHGQNSILGMPPGHPSNVPSNLNTNQNQQRAMGMRKGSGQAGGQRREKRQNVEKDGHRDKKSSGKNKIGVDHRGRGRGHGRGQGQGGRKRNNTGGKNSEVSSECGNEENDESEEDYSDSEDTDTEIAEKTKPKSHEFKTSTDSLRNDKSPQKKILQDPGNQADREPTEPPEENEVFKYLIKEVGGPISVKNIAQTKLFPKELDIPSWFRSHQRRFIMFENKEKNYQFIVPFYKEATFCLDYNHLFKQERCDQSDCPHAHICKDFIAGSCKQGQKCPFSHNFYDRANIGLISKLGLDHFNNEEIRLIYSLRFPHVCGKHTPTRICRLPACAYLHICINNLFGRCEHGSDCRLSHSLETEQNKSVLKAYQLAHWNEPLLKKVIFLNAFVNKGNTDPKDISPHGSKESIPDMRYNTQNRLNRQAGSTSNLQNEQKSKFHGRSKSTDARKLHGGSLAVPSNKSHGYDSDDKEQMNSRKEEVKTSSKKRIQRKEESTGRTGSLEPKSDNPEKNDGGRKTKRPKPRNKLNNEENKTSADSVLKTDAAQSIPICDLYLVDKCKTATCKFHHHDSIKLPYIWQIKIFNSWLTLDKLKMVEVEKAFCKNSCTIQTSIFYEGLNYNAKLELDTMTAVVTDSGSSSSPVNTSARRLSTKSYAEGAKPSAEDSFKTQWRWFFDEFGRFCLMEPELLQFTLEQKFTRKCQNTYMFCRESYRFKYRIDFEKMEQINVETGMVRKLLRRPLFVSAEDVANKQYPEKSAVSTRVKVPLPVGWVPWDLAHAFELVELKQTSAEFKKVQRSFQDTLNPTEIHISYIYRVQNSELWMAYDGQKKIMKISLERAGQTKEVDERNLFHGTDSMDTVQGICTNSFDFRICGKHGAKYGKGAYFARDAKYSHCYTNNSSATADRYMFYARVLVGEYTVGSSTYTRPPEKPGGTAHQLFDSCVDNVDNPSIFVVFDLKQCYPEYLICYKKLEELSIKEAPLVRPSKIQIPSMVEQIKSLSLLDQSIKPTSNIHTYSSSVEKDNVLEFLTEEARIVKPIKNARPKVKPSPLQDQYTTSESSVHRSSSPVETHTASGLSDSYYSPKPPKSVSTLINSFNNITISSSPSHLPLTDPPPQSSRRSSGASISQAVYQRDGLFEDDTEEILNRARSVRHKLVSAVPDSAPQIRKTDSPTDPPSKPFLPPNPQASIKPQEDNRSPLPPRPLNLYFI